MGRWHAGPERALYEHFIQRFRPLLPKLGFSSFELIEIPERRANIHGIEAAIPQGAKIIVLDAKGHTYSSEEIAQILQQFRTKDMSALVFLIGGADGLPDTLQKKAALILSFGRITIPHLLARGILAEQLYRAGTILLNHPYHRSGKSP